MANIIFLHGASSSGKSTLAAEILRQSPLPFLNLSIDHLRDSGAWDTGRYKNWRNDRSAFFDGFHHAIAAFADCGNHVLLEHILDTKGWHSTLQSLFHPHDVLFIALHADTDTLATRERDRGDRPIGSAVADQRSIHTGMAYDLELNGAADPAQNAQRVLDLRHHQRSKSAFFT